MRGKSTSERNLSGVGCNFRVFQGQTKPRFFQGLPGFVGHPVVEFTVKNIYWLSRNCIWQHEAIMAL